jgi:hypothetical protein
MATAKQTARALFRANRKDNKSWPCLSREGLEADDIKVLPGIAAGTLCRIAKSKGAWLPKDIEILKLLGLHHEKQPRPKSIWDMSANELLHALNNRQCYQPVMTQKELREYVRACKGASA